MSVPRLPIINNFFSVFGVVQGGGGGQSPQALLYHGPNSHPVFFLGGEGVGLPRFLDEILDPPLNSRYIGCTRTVHGI